MHLSPKSILLIFSCLAHGSYTVRAESEVDTTSIKPESVTEVTTGVVTIVQFINSTISPPNSTTVRNETEQLEANVTTTSASVAVEPCPTGCTCTSIPDAVCTQQGLNDIPTGLSNRLKMLILTSNNISELGENTFKDRNIYDLRSLSLNRNAIQNIHPHAFSTLKYLEVLDLGDNKLSKLDPNLFVNNSALITLRVDKNSNLQLPTEGPFLNIPNLRELNISACNLIALPSSIFTGIPALDTIDLRHNKIQDLDISIFKNLTSLQKLILPQSLQEKAAEICLQVPILRALTISSTDGNENLFDCIPLRLSPDKVLQSNKNPEPESSIEASETPVDEEISKEIVANKEVTEEKNVKTISVNEVPPVDETHSHMKSAETTVDKSGLSGQQVDNIIIGVMFGALAVVLLVGLIKYRRTILSKCSSEPTPPPRSNTPYNPTTINNTEDTELQPLQSKINGSQKETV